MMVSNSNSNIFWSPSGEDLGNGIISLGGWYFWDETGLLGHGPYSSEKCALSGLELYIKCYLS